MSLYSLLRKEDYLMIKWPITMAVLGLIIAAAIYFGIDYISAQSVQDLRIAQADFNGARSRVELIEEEEARIIEYIERYRTLAAEGVVEDEDRLQMHEIVAEIRSSNNLFPVSLTLYPQSSMRLDYPPEIREPGEPVALRSSRISVDLPLLHEQDLVRLLNGILESPGLYQTKECELSQQNANATSFIVLSQHFKATCELLWYTFDLSPPQPAPFGGF